MTVKPIVTAPTTLAKLARVDHLFAGDTLIIASATTPGKLYQVTDHGCTCPAGDFSLKCWHQAARRHLIANMVQTETLELPVIGGPQTAEEIDALEDARQLRDALAELDAAPRKQRMSDEEYQRILDECDEITSKPVRRQRKVEAL